MANDLTEVIPKLLVQGLRALRESAVMPLLVNRQYETTAGEKGSTIDVPIPSAIIATTVAPANIAPNPGDTVPTSVPIPLSEWKEAAFFLTDKDQLEAIDDIMPMQASEAIKALANNVDQFILGLHVAFFGVAGTAGTTPFTGGTTEDATELRKVLNEQLAPPDDRWAVLDPDAEQKALDIRAFQDMSWNGSTAAIIEGQLNRKMGFGWFLDQNVPTHTQGTGTLYVTSGTPTVGDTVIPLITGSGTIVVGDIITFAGDSQTYTVLVGIAAPGSITISPALRVTQSGGDAVTIFDTHVVNLGFHRDAIAFASRPLQRYGSEFGVVSQTAIDPVSGLALRVEAKHEFKRLRFSYDILYGAAVIRPELGARLLG